MNPIKVTWIFNCSYNRCQSKQECLHPHIPRLISNKQFGISMQNAGNNALFNTAGRAGISEMCLECYNGSAPKTQLNPTVAVAPFSVLRNLYNVRSTDLKMEDPLPSKKGIGF